MNSIWKAILGSLLIFLLGIVAGALLTAGLLKHRMTILFQRGGPALVEVLERRMTRHLVLTPGQKAQIHQDLMENVEARRKLVAPLQPQMRELNEKTIIQITQSLHADQVGTFQKNLADLRQRFRHSSATPADETAAAPAAPPQ